jgi:cytochrome b561
VALRNTDDTFGGLAKFFHWTIALFIIGLLCFGFYMVGIQDEAQREQAFNMHKLFGLSVLLLACLRLLWRWMNPVPVLPSMPKWELALEKLVKFSLYAALFAMPISGWIFSTAAGHAPHLGQFYIPAPFVKLDITLAGQVFKVHQIIGWSIIVLLCMHVAGALKHHFVNKDNILRRMMPGYKIK